MGQGHFANSAVTKYQIPSKWQQIIVKPTAGCGSQTLLCGLWRRRLGTLIVRHETLHRWSSYPRLYAFSSYSHFIPASYCITVLPDQWRETSRLAFVIVESLTAVCQYQTQNVTSNGTQICASLHKQEVSTSLAPRRVETRKWQHHFILP